jgi:diadenosine tetraphosphate (Ap4A) HIT family hydrolase
MIKLCKFCNLLQLPQNDPTFITEFKNSAAFLDFDQATYRGESLLIFKNHHEHLHLTPEILQQAVVPELINLTTAILKAFGGFRANHLSLGNQVAHVHWHIVPRYPKDVNEGYAPERKSSVQRLSDNEYRLLAANVRSALE